MEQTKGFRTITYRFRIYSEHEAWFWETKKIYNRVLEFYYDILTREQGLTELNKQKVMRHLEILSIGTKNGEEPKYPVPFEKVPLYFRRAAINDAVRLYRSFDSGKGHGAKPAGNIDSAPTFYKGMYKEFCSTSVMLKLFNGSNWEWVSCSIDICGRVFPKTKQILSPTLVLTGNRAMLHVPVKEEVLDVRPVKERLDNNEKICAVYLPNSDTMAAMVVLDIEGKLLASRFIHGGRELAHRKSVYIKRIEENRKSMGGNKEKLPAEENKALKEKIHRITDNIAHKVSREIIDFCKEQGASILVVPNYKQSMDFNRIGYVTATNYDWLGRRIISYVKYKSFGEGIVTATASTKNIASRCYQCGEPVKKYNEGYRPGKNFYGGKNFVCPNGHQGSSYFNSAMNVGRNFLRYMSEK